MRTWIKSNSTYAYNHWQSGGSNKNGSWDIIPRIYTSKLAGYTFPEGNSFLQGITTINTSRSGKSEAAYTNSNPVYMELCKIARDGGTGRNVKKGDHGTFDISLKNNITGKPGLILYFAALLFLVRYADNSYKIFYVGDGFYNQESLPNASQFTGSYTDDDFSIVVTGNEYNVTVPTWGYSTVVNSREDFTGTVTRTMYDAEAGVKVSLNFNSSVSYIAFYGFCVGTNGYDTDAYYYNGQTHFDTLPIFSDTEYSNQHVIWKFNIT